MPLVRVRLLHGKMQLAAPSRPFQDETTLQHIVSKALEPFSGCSVSVLEVFPTADEPPMKKSQFYPSDFEEIKLIDVASMGYFWIAHVHRADGPSTPGLSTPGLSTPGTPAARRSPDGLSDGLDNMMERSRGEAVTWPPPATGPTFNVRIFNALINDLKAEGLGWHRNDCSHADSSGTKLLKVLSQAILSPPHPTPSHCQPIPSPPHPPHLNLSHPHSSPPHLNPSHTHPTPPHLNPSYPHTTPPHLNPSHPH